MLRFFPQALVLNNKPPRGTFALGLTISAILAGAIILTLLFANYWNKLNRKVETILRDQFNQQQLMLARKIADNVESYFDYLESELLAYPYRFQVIKAPSPDFSAYMAARFRDMHSLGILEIRWYDRDGKLKESWGRPGNVTPVGQSLPQHLQLWVTNPANKGRLFLGKTAPSTEPPYRGRLVMPFLTALYASPEAPEADGSLELLIDPFFISAKVTEGVRSGETGYPWIIDQNNIYLAHYEKDFVGKDAIKVRLARNPRIVFRGVKEMHERLLAGQEGTTEYVSGWHRQTLGETPKLAAYTPIRFDRGLIRGVTTLEDPAHNLWGVALVAPVEEVSGQVGEVLHQEIFLVGLFFLAILLGSGGFITLALRWNTILRREVELKTQELLQSHERLLRSERFAAVGEAAAYVSHEIKNPLMIIGGLAGQVQRKLASDPPSQEKLTIVQNEVKRLENFLGELRDFTRPAAPAKRPIDLNQVIGEVENLVQNEANNRGISLVRDLDASLPPVEADPNQMKQVILNLVKNAFEALDQGGSITLSSGANDHQVWFSVRDTGMGIPRESLDKIFNPFFTTKEKGSGLGLAVIHKIITDHHGTVAVESTPGQGTTFMVKLPKNG